MPSLADIPFLGGYTQQDQMNRAQEGKQLVQAGALQGLLAKMQAAQQERQMRETLAQAGGDPAKAVQALLANGSPASIGLAAKLKGLMPKPAEPYTLTPGAQRFGPDNKPLASFPKPAEPYTLSPGAQRFDASGQMIASVPPNPPAERFSNVYRLLQEKAALPPGDPRHEIYANAIRKETETAKQISPTVVMPRQPHFERTVGDDGTVKVHAFDANGDLIKTTEPGGKAPSILSNENVRERQLATALEAVKKPHLEVLNAYQRYEQIKGTGDNSQANQFLAQQLMQMSRTGQRVIPKAELERILGSGDLGNDWIGRAANMVTQMAAGVRTPSIDKRLNDLADAMAKSSADRIGQEIQNTRARTPAGVAPERVVGAKPTIYGRFIISPTGKVHVFNSSAEAQTKLQEASQMVGQ